MTKFCLLFLLLGLAQISLGQASPTTTTLSTAMDNAQTYIVPAALTGFVAQLNGVHTVLYVDREVMFVDQTNSPIAGYATVSRGALGTVSSSHIAGATVLVGPPNMFAEGDPYGSCPSPLPSTPWINIRTGVQWSCTSGVWALTSSIGGGSSGSGFNNLGTLGGSFSVNLSLGCTQQVTLNASSSLSVTSLSSCQGKSVIFIFRQDSTGSRTLSWPAAVHGGMTIGVMPNLYSVQTFVVDASSTILLAASAGVVNQ